MTGTTIKRRVEKLEGPLAQQNAEKIDLIFIVGVAVENSTDDEQEPLAHSNIRPSESAPENFHAFCLHPLCPSREHARLNGETLEQMEARLTTEHKGLAA